MLPRHIERLASHPEAQVLLVDSDQIALRGQDIYRAVGVLPSALILLGVDANCSDWSPLTGRKVGVWLAAGGQAALRLANQLVDIVPVVKILAPPSTVRDGWSLADPLPVGFDLLAYTKAAAMPLAEFREKFELVPEAEEQAQTLPVTIGGVQLMQPTDFPDLSTKQRPLNTINNLAALMQWFGISARYNLVRKDTEMLIPGLWGTSDNAQNVRLAHLNSLAARCGLPRANLPEYVAAIADMEAYNPVVDWIDSEPWDGVTRISELAETLECKDPKSNEQCEKLLRRWLISCAAALLHQGFWCKGVLTLQGAQDLGKTSWFRRLVPTELGAFREGVSLDPNNKDSVTTAVSHWIVELGELESTLRREIESLKAFITQTVDRLRRPFDRLDSEYPRRTVFCASVNSERFLKDETGNDRFWVIEVVKVNHRHDVDMQQLWAEVMVLYRSGEQWHLDAGEKALLTEANKEFRQVSPFEELLLAKFSTVGDGGKYMNASQTLIELGYDRPTRAQTTEAGQVLSRLGASSRKSAGSKQYYLSRLSCSSY